MLEEEDDVVVVVVTIGRYWWMLDDVLAVVMGGVVGGAACWCLDAEGALCAAWRRDCAEEFELGATAEEVVVLETAL